MSQRKKDHINMAAKSWPSDAFSDQRFNYEPLLAAHPSEASKTDFLGKEMDHPLWVSSMTGGTKEANVMNKRLAEACAEFGLGMGLGSCRTLLRSDEHLDDFDLRPIIGSKQPFYANLGIAQIELMLKAKTLGKVHDLIDKLGADGLFVHVNPTQEWLQPEGDRYQKPALETIEELIKETKGAYKLIVKEVGQGMGPESLENLLKLDIDGLEFGAFGGTNFATIEIMRKKDGPAQFMHPLATFGHNANEMVDIVNNIVLNHPVKCKQIIVSGGISNFLDGYYYTEKAAIKAVYGMAGTLLKHARESKKELFDFVKAEVDGFKYAKSFLSLKK